MTILTKNEPIVSVLMAAYNAEAFVEEAVKSVLNERKIELELIFVNDHSTDNTAKIVEHIAKNDDRIKIINRTTNNKCNEIKNNVFYVGTNGQRGLPYSLNLGLQYCKGQFIARMDADDICMPNRFIRQITYMEEHPEIDFLASSAVRINKEGKPFGLYHSQPIEHEEIVQRIQTFRAYGPHPTWFVRKELFDGLGGYNQDGFRAEDLDFMLRATEIPGVKFAFITEPLIYLRMHDSSLSYTASSEPVEFAISAVVRHMLRVKGCENVEDKKYSILDSVREKVIATKLHKKIAAYNTLRFAYISLRTNSILQSVLGFLVSFRLSPTIAINYKKFSMFKLRLADEVANNYLRKIK